MEPKKDILNILKDELHLANDKIIFITDKEGKIILFNSLFVQLCDVANIDSALLKGEINIRNIFLCDNEFDDVYSEISSKHIWQGELFFILSYDKKLQCESKGYLLKINSKVFNYIFNLEIKDFRHIEEDSIQGQIKYNKLNLSPMIMGFDNELKSKSNSEKESIVSNLSHEFRTPLTSIIGFTETIKADPHIDLNTRNEFLSIILDESRKLTAIINEMIELLDFERGSSHLIKTEENINTILQNISLIFSSVLAEANITINLELPEIQTTALINRDKFEQLIVYLIDNAFKNIKTDGTIKVILSEQENNFSIDITDSGELIPKGEINNVFKRFYKVDQPNLKINNLGFGLAICKAIVNIHKGTIKVESEESIGNKFTIIIPKS